MHTKKQMRQSIKKETEKKTKTENPTLLGENLWLYSTENIYDSTPLRIFMTLLH
jgi:hypothetical protein